MRLLTENLVWKVLALGIATFLWYGFVGQTELATSAPVAIQYKNVPPNLEVTSEQLDRVFLRVRGPATRLTQGNLAEVLLQLDLSQVAGPGEHTFTLSPENLLLPAGVSMVRVVPSQVRLNFEKRSARDVPVEIRYSGPPPRGYRISGQHAWPPRVRIVGAESRVDNVNSVQTDAIDLTTTISNSEFRVPAFLPDPQLRFDGNPPMVSVRVLMEKIPQ